MRILNGLLNHSLASKMILGGLLSSLILSGCSDSQVIDATSVDIDVEQITIEGLGIRYEPEQLERGYIQVRLDSETADPNSTYLVWIKGESESKVSPELPSDLEGNDFNTDTPWQFTLNNFTEWTMLPLPYADQEIVLFKMDNEDYEKSLVTPSEGNGKYGLLGYPEMVNVYVVPTELVGSLWIRDAGNYLDSEECFTSKTVWIYWEDNSNLTMIADRLFECCDNDPQAYAKYVMEYLNTNMTYNHDREPVKNYDLLVDDNFRSSGMCFDHASTFCAMMRSQGIACRFIEGNVLKADGTIGDHAWNQVIFEGGIKELYDATENSTLIDRSIYKALIVK